MGHARAVLIEAEQVGNVAETIYTCPVDTTVLVQSFVVANPNAVAYYIKVWRVPHGDLAADDTIWCPQTYIPPYGSVDLCGILGTMLLRYESAAGDFIRVISDTNNKLTIQAHGITET